MGSLELGLHSQLFLRSLWRLPSLQKPATKPRNVDWCSLPVPAENGGEAPPQKIAVNRYLQDFQQKHRVIWPLTVPPTERDIIGKKGSTGILGNLLKN